MGAAAYAAALAADHGEGGGMNQDIRLTLLDDPKAAKLPNMALMRLSAWHKSQGDRVHYYTTPYRQLGEPDYGVVYASAIFGFSSEAVRAFAREFPGAIVGGTGTPSSATVEDIVGDFQGLDYGPWPAFTASLGFTQRGCRMACDFCVVPKKEGKPLSVATIADIWRGAPYPKHLHLLDNDFFGNPHWRDRIAEIIEGGFKVCWNQGINVRILSNEVARAVASVDYRSDDFRRRQVYTAWDNYGDERIFFRGIDRLEDAGVPPSRVMAYMLVGYDPAETWERVFYRFDKMVARGIRPYIMPYEVDKAKKLPLGGYNGRVGHFTLGNFQRWVNGAIYRRGVPFERYDANAKSDPLFKLQPSMFGDAA